jgi:drug/metabolite transporter (DMT)-like permease
LLVAVRRLLILAFIWGWSFLFIKVAVEGLTPPSVAFGRVALGATVLVITLRVRRQPLPTDRSMWRHFTLAALFGNAVPFTLLAWGEQRITSALTAVLNASTPLFTAIVVALYLGDRMTRRQLVGLLLGFAGVGIAAGFGGGDLAHSSVLGSLAAVGAGACYGVAFAYMRKHLIGVEPIVAAGGQLIMASVLLAPFAIATSAQSGVHMTVRRSLALAALGVFGTGFAYILNYRVIAELGATAASLVTYVVPIVAVAVGIVVLDEPFEPRIVLGGLIIVSGIALVRGSKLLRRAPAVVVMLVLALTAGCSGSSTGAASGCGPPQREAIDPNQGHVLPGAPEPRYRTDPPTSGPHLPGLPPQGVLSQPLTRPAQVGALEGGAVLLQYRDLSPEEQQQLFAIAGDKVVVAPNPELPERVVATAWLFKQRCSRVDAAVLRGFAAEHAGKGPGTDG